MRRPSPSEIASGNSVRAYKPASGRGFDGNGNLVGLVDAVDGWLVAAYEYDPYGNAVRATGRYAAENPFRFCTKYYDKETGLSNYGFRYYSASLGRFVNRDPLDERGGWTLFSDLQSSVSNDFAGSVAVNGRSAYAAWESRQDALLSSASLAHSSEGVQMGKRSNSTLASLSESQVKYYSANSTPQNNQGGSDGWESPNIPSLGNDSPGAGNANISLYLYAGNNPVNSFDAWGLDDAKDERYDPPEIVPMATDDGETFSLGSDGGKTGNEKSKSPYKTEIMRNAQAEIDALERKLWGSNSSTKNSILQQLGYSFSLKNPYNPLAIANNLLGRASNALGEMVRMYNYAVEEGVAATGGNPADAEILKFWGPVAVSAGMSNLRWLQTANSKQLVGLTFDEFSKGGYIYTERMSKARFAKEFADVPTAGLRNRLIDFVESGGQKYVVGGNSRLRAAIKYERTYQLTFREVQLPYKNYKTFNDVYQAGLESRGR